MDDPDPRAALAARLQGHLTTAASLRAHACADPQRAAGRTRLRDWQGRRLAATYPDLLDAPRYAPAARFFLDELYGSNDLGERDAEIARILPMLERTLPRAGLETLDLALELDALSEQLDAAMVDALAALAPDGRIDAAVYRAAWCRVGQRDARARQIELVERTGWALEALAARPVVAGALRLMRTPARMLGLDALHAFLENGFTAFRQMGQADDFLGTIATRERAFMQRQFDGPDGLPDYQSQPAGQT